MTNKTRWIIAFGAIIVLFTYGLLQLHSLRQNAVLASGVVIAFTTSPKSTYVFVEYKFELQGKIYISKSSIIGCGRFTCLSRLQRNLAGDEIPVVFHKNDPSNSRAVLTSKEFVDLGIDIPEKFIHQIRLVDEMIQKGQ